MEGNDGVTEDDEPSLTESEVKEEGEKAGREEKIKEVEVTPKDSGETTESSSLETIKPVAVVPKVETSDTLLIKVETEDTSDMHSVSDVPSTPPSTDFTTTPEPESQPSDLVDENVRDHLALREETSSKDTLVRAILSSAEVMNDTALTSISSSKADADETSSVETTKPTNPEDKTEEKEDEEKTEIIRVTTTPSGQKIMEGWEMLEMVLNWVKNEFSPDEKALARQLANDEISFRFLWLYYVPGSLISVEDPVSKQQMAARVSRSLCPLSPRLFISSGKIFINNRSRIRIICHLQPTFPAGWKSILRSLVRMATTSYIPTWSQIFLITTQQNESANYPSNF